MDYAGLDGPVTKANEVLIRSEHTVGTHSAYTARVFSYLLIELQDTEHGSEEDGHYIAVPGRCLAKQCKQHVVYFSAFGSNMHDIRSNQETRRPGRLREGF